MHSSETALGRVPAKEYDIQPALLGRPAPALSCPTLRTTSGHGRQSSPRDASASLSEAWVGRFSPRHDSLHYKALAGSYAQQRHRREEACHAGCAKLYRSRVSVPGRELWRHLNGVHETVPPRSKAGEARAVVKAGGSFAAARRRGIGSRSPGVFAF
eukprot:scaffold1509_cov240-Pinguiococcus_pyrenoidosus.AAC.26